MRITTGYAFNKLLHLCDIFFLIYDYFFRLYASNEKSHTQVPLMSLLAECEQLCKNEILKEMAEDGYNYNNACFVLYYFHLFCMWHCYNADISEKFQTLRLRDEAGKKRSQVVDGRIQARNGFASLPT